MKIILDDTQVVECEGAEGGLAGTDGPDTGTGLRRRAGPARRQRCSGRGPVRASSAGPAQRRRPGVCRRVRAVARLDQGDGADLRGELPDDQVPAEPDRRAPRLRRHRPRAHRRRCRRPPAAGGDQRPGGAGRAGRSPMIPQLVTAGYRRANGRWLRLYIPVVPVVLVLSPLLLLAVLGGLGACLAFRVSPVGALCGTARLLWA